MLSPGNETHGWREDSASEEQIRRLAAHGLLELRAYSRWEASALLEHAAAANLSPEWNLAEESADDLEEVWRRSLQKAIRGFKEKLSGENLSDEERDALEERLGLLSMDIDTFLEETRSRDREEDSGDRVSELVEEFEDSFYVDRGEILRPSRDQILESVKWLDSEVPKWEAKSADGGDQLLKTLLKRHPELRTKPEEEEKRDDHLLEARRIAGKKKPAIGLRSAVPLGLLALGVIGLLVWLATDDPDPAPLAQNNKFPDLLEPPPLDPPPSEPVPPVPLETIPDEFTDPDEQEPFESRFDFPMTVTVQKRVGIAHDKGVHGVKAGDSIEVLDFQAGMYIIRHRGREFSVPPEILLDAGLSEFANP